VAAYLDPDNNFHRDGAASSIACPHCGMQSHMRVGSVPDFAQLQIQRPEQVGIALQCDACHMPVFFRYAVRAYRTRRIEFFADGYQVERPTETFSYGYLPDPVAAAFKDALGCYSNGLRTAFVVMCRRTVLSIFNELGDRGKLRCYEQADEIQQLANIDPGDFDVVRRIIFEMDLDQATDRSTITHMQAAILLETMRDMLHQVYVRGGKLQKALELRRYFAEQAQLSEKGYTQDQPDDNKKSGRDDESIIERVIKRADRE
jgi:hypothetical protein